MSVSEIGKTMVEMVDQGTESEANFVSEYDADDVVSLEGQGSEDMPHRSKASRRSRQNTPGGSTTIPCTTPRQLVRLLVAKTIHLFCTFQWTSRLRAASVCK